MAQQNRRQRAFGLVEVLLATAIAGVLLLAMAMALSGLISATKTNQSYLQARHNANTSLNYILTHVRRARELSLGSAGTSANEYLSLTTTDPAVYDAASGTWTDRYTVFQFDPDTHTLSIAHGSSASAQPAPVLNHVANMVFRSVTEGGKNRYVTVEIAIDMPAPNGSGHGSASFTLAGTAVSRSL